MKVNKQRSVLFIFIAIVVFLGIFSNQKDYTAFSNQDSMNDMVDTAQQTIESSSTVRQNKAASEEFIHVCTSSELIASLSLQKGMNLRFYHVHSTYLEIAVVIALLLFLIHIIVVWLFGRRRISLWNIIGYIHLLDGKKKHVISN